MYLSNTGILFYTCTHSVEYFYTCSKSFSTLLSLRGESPVQYSYPYNNPPTEMEKNPAYATIETGQSVGSQNDEGNVMDHSYATIDAREDNIASYSALSDEDATIGREEDNTEASALSDEDTLQSTSEPSYI